MLMSISNPSIPKMVSQDIFLYKETKSCFLILYAVYICPGQAHCLDMHTNTALIDLTMLGNLIDLYHCLDNRFYSQATHAAEDAEMEHARTVFRCFKLSFSNHQHLLFNSDRHPVNPMARFFEPSIVHFASSLVKYKSMMAAYDDAFSLEDLERVIQVHFQRHYPNLLPSLLENSKPDAQSCDPCLHWTGPDFSIGEGAYKSLQNDTSKIGKSRIDGHLNVQCINRMFKF